MRKCIAYILIAILSFQVLPVKELGRLLFKAQMTEEIHEHCHDDTAMKFKKHIPFRDFLFSHSAQEIYLNARVNIAMHAAAQVAHQHFPDIFVPPPNA